MGVFDDLEKQLEADAVDAENWIPNTGDKLRGTVRARGVYQGNWGPVARLRIEDEANKMWSVLMGGAMLKEFVDDFDPQPGDKILIEYKGKKLGKNGSEYNVYKAAGIKDPAPPAQSTSVADPQDDWS